MSNHRSWQEQQYKNDKYEEHRTLSIFPIDRGFLITLRNHFTDRNKPSDNFGHQEGTFFASFEQASDIVHMLLTHIRSKQIHPDPSSPDNPIPSS